MLTRRIRKLQLIFHRCISEFFLRHVMASCGSGLLIEKPLFINYEVLHVGDRFRVWPNARIEGVEEYFGQKFNPSIVVGNNFSVQQDFHCVICNRLEIGDDVTISKNVTILDNEHDYSAKNALRGKLKVEPVIIEDSVFIGANSTILAGTKIGRCVTIGANSVVKGVLVDYGIYAGNPARKIESKNS
jgi:acetyltransferase-like isoleucine patch superfamily enzyme